MTTVVAIGVTADGERQVLGVDADPSEDAAFFRFHHFVLVTASHFTKASY